MTRRSRITQTTTAKTTIYSIFTCFRDGREGGPDETLHVGHDRVDGEDVPSLPLHTKASLFLCHIRQLVTTHRTTMVMMVFVAL